MDKDRYAKIREAYSQLTTFDAVGLVGAELKRGSINLDEPFIFAAVLKVNEAAAKTIDVDALHPDHRAMLSSQFVTNLQGVLNFL